MPFGAGKVALLGAAGSGGGGSSIEPIQTSTSTAASLTFTSIPQTYKHLWMVWTLPGNSSNWGNAYTYAENDPSPNYSASHIFYDHDYSLAIYQTDAQPTGYGLKMAYGDDSVSTSSVQYHEFLWPYYSDAAGSGTTSRWLAASGSGYTGNPNTAFYSYLTALNEYGGSTATLPITELTVKFGDGTALPSGTTRTLYGIN